MRCIDDSIFHRLTLKWFAEAFREPTLTQIDAWTSIASGKNTLVVAPTGTGKTLSAFLFGIDSLVRLAESAELSDELQILYITPLKALGNDIAENLKKPLAGIRARFEAEGIALPEIRAAIRHGDTPQRERSSMQRKPPHILVTTPESLFIMLTSEKSRRMISTVNTVIVDEIHSVISSKRGASLSVSLERLDELTRANTASIPQRIGLSATVADKEITAAFLAGALNGVARPCNIVAPLIDKQVKLTVELPEKLSSENSIWPAIARRVYEASKPLRTVLVFVNGRAQAEKIAAAVNALSGQGAGRSPALFGGLGAEPPIEEETYALSHHGSLSKEKRLQAEQLFRSGKLKVLCATSSMELGIDVGFVDLVFQIGSVPLIANGLQRLGRAGHSPNSVSNMRILAKTDRDALDAALCSSLILGRQIEDQRPIELYLDVLAQHILSLVSVAPTRAEDMLALFRGAWGLRGLDRETLLSVVRMLAGEFENAQMMKARPRVYFDGIHDKVSGDKYTRMLACAASTIPDRGLYPVFLAESGARLGELDEECVFETRIGDKIMLGTFAWRVERIERDRVVVSATDRNGARIPFWKGEGFGRPIETGLRMGEIIRRVEANPSKRALEREFPLDSFTEESIRALIKKQISENGRLGTDKRIVLEHFATESGWDALVLHSVFGGKVNLGLMELLRSYLNERTCGDILSFHDDASIALFAVGGFKIPRDVLSNAIQSVGTDLASIIDKFAKLLPSTPLFSVVFRHAAARAMMFGARNGRRQPLWVQRERGARALDVALKHAEHPLLQETLRECLTEHIDAAALANVLRDVSIGNIDTVEVWNDSASQMSRNLLNEFAAFEMYDYNPTPAAASRSEVRLSETVGGIIGGLRKPDKVIMEEARLKKALSNKDALHAWFLAGGDASADEVLEFVTAADGEEENRERLAQWADELLRDGRILYLDIGVWIAAEHASQYDELSDNLPFIIKRRLNFRAGASAAELESIYAAPVGDALRALEESGEAVLFEDVWYSAEEYRRASVRTSASLRRSVKTVPPENYAAFLLRRLIPPYSQGGLENVPLLCGTTLPAERWENEIFPARVPKYTKQILDNLLLSGRIGWRMAQDEAGKLAVTFTKCAGSVGKETPPPQGEKETAVFDILKSNGALFTSDISLLAGFDAKNALVALVKQGIVTNDNYAPVRAILAGGLRTREKLLSAAGRWSLIRSVSAKAEDALTDSFARYGVVCKETTAGASRTEALSILRLWEFRGKVRRGYFVCGMSGAQFVLDEEYAQVSAQLASPTSDIYVVPARDPALAWGSLIPHKSGMEFTRVQGTVVVLRSGLPKLIAERFCEVIRLIDMEGAAQYTGALAAAYRNAQIYKEKPRLRVLEYDKSAEQPLLDAGFERDGGGLTLWRMESQRN
ncbi:MAG: DEAD/DEAH box helicase [Oscillospiraceae bacterium]|jgi:ATP-dependent Lhr-like helicase|nr:DEAD/DEAH box helicase [Oscillospiraceae bacterium]